MAASSSFSNRAKQVAPLPDIRARRHPLLFSSACRVSAITGTWPVAAFSRSFVLCRKKAINSSASSGLSGIEKGRRPFSGFWAERSNKRKISGVGQGRPGFTKSTGTSGKKGAGFKTSPIPVIWTGAAARHAGTSAPSAPASAEICGCGHGSPQKTASPHKTAAASLEPPPIPPQAACF